MRHKKNTSNNSKRKSSHILKVSHARKREKEREMYQILGTDLATPRNAAKSDDEDTRKQSVGEQHI